ncbi:transcriptional pleiotropic regulator of transition state genes [Halarsenatibacter silvermanii]|uniref:Transcriptional pleiotropic regulator of transition state genes n=1 Tax=Halarsenatibacter silvermanii TaxID=321763 RepID=A0A1G9TTT2_9FIRM|nr:transcriptional pleiotropic regulator of transition state genes [Halarsenatibacter silvermanii]
MEIYVDEETVILKKYQPDCTLCGGLEDLVTINDKNVCESCIIKLDGLTN